MRISQTKKKDLEAFISKYSDLVYDLCIQLALTPEKATYTFREIFKALIIDRKKIQFLKYERTWVLQTALQIILEKNPKSDHRLKTFEAEVLQNLETPDDRIKHISIFLKRLSPQDYFLVLCHLKHGISLQELAGVFNKPERTLSFQYAQAMQALEEWIWFEKENHLEAMVRLIKTQETQSFPKPKDLIHFVYQKTKSSDKKTLKQKWVHLPWWGQNIIEAFAIGMVIFGVLTLVPQARKIYEKKIQQRLEDMSITQIGTQAQIEAPPEVIPATEEDAPASETSATTENDVRATKTIEEIKVGQSEVWRVSIRTDSSSRLKSDIYNLLIKNKIPQNTPNLRGKEAPGGVLFDLLIDQDKLPQILKDLKTLSETTALKGVNTPVDDPFTWYKNKSRKQLEDQKTRIIIWISEL